MSSVRRIGRKIYYNKHTGEVIVDTGEREGYVVPTKIEQDFAAYPALQQYESDQVGVLQLEYGQYADRFARYHYSIDPLTGTIVWNDLIASP